MDDGLSEGRVDATLCSVGHAFVRQVIIFMMWVVSLVKPITIPPCEALSDGGGYPLYVGHGFQMTSYGHHESHVSPPASGLE